MTSLPHPPDDAPGSAPSPDHGPGDASVDESGMGVRSYRLRLDAWCRSYPDGRWTGPPADELVRALVVASGHVTTEHEVEYWPRAGSM